MLHYWNVPAIPAHTRAKLELFVNDERVNSECSSAGWLTVSPSDFSFFPLLLQSGSHLFSLIVQVIIVVFVVFAVQ